MGLTVALPAANILPSAVVGALRMTIRDITFDSSYPTGGESLTAAQLGLVTVFFCLAQKAVTTSRTTGLDVYYDIAAAKLVAYYSTTTAVDPEATNTNDLSTFTVRLLSFGV